MARVDRATGRVRNLRANSKGRALVRKNPNMPCTGPGGPVKPGHDEKSGGVGHSFRRLILNRRLLGWPVEDLFKHRGDIQQSLLAEPGADDLQADREGVCRETGGDRDCWMTGE